MVLCSDENDRLHAINYMAEKIIASGYKTQELEAAKVKLLALAREKLLSPNVSGNFGEKHKRTITFVINHDGNTSRQVR